MNKIILIGGTPRCGKTTLAEKISKEYGMSWLSTDALESIAHQYTPENDRATLFPKSEMRKKTNRNNDELYEKYSVEEILESYEQQAKATGKAITSIVEYAIKDDWSYVIEGYHITPELISQIETTHQNQISSVILINTNTGDLIERSRSSTTKNDWVRDGTKNNETYEKVGAMISLYSERLLKEAQKHDVKVVDMGDSFDTRFDEVFQSLTR
jgi:2-phosphoglycerate kinase